MKKAQNLVEFLIRLWCSLEVDFWNKYSEIEVLYTRKVSFIYLFRHMGFIDLEITHMCHVGLTLSTHCS